MYLVILWKGLIRYELRKKRSPILFEMVCVHNVSSKDGGDKTGFCTYSKKLDASFLHENRLLWEVLEVEGIVEEVLLKCHEELPQLHRTLGQGAQLRQDHTTQEEDRI